MANDGSTSLVKYDTPMGPVELSVEAIRLYLCPKATVEEAYIFLQKCRFQQLNPFMGEAYLVVYDGQQGRSTSMIIGKEAHTRRAERHPDYLGMEAGLIVSRGNEVKEVPGAFMVPGDKLLGGWAKVRRKGKDPTFISVSLSEYDNTRRQWKQMPATMIRKVAVVQALREAFPNDMAGLQGGGEFDLAEERQVVEGEVVDRRTGEIVDGAASAPEPQGVATESDVAQFQSMLDRDLGLLKTTPDLFSACFEDFKVQPRDVLRITGYGRAADMEGQDLAQCYNQVKASLR